MNLKCTNFRLKFQFRIPPIKIQTLTTDWYSFKFQSHLRLSFQFRIPPAGEEWGSSHFHEARWAPPQASLSSLFSCRRHRFWSDLNGFRESWPSSCESWRVALATLAAGRAGERRRRRANGDHRRVSPLPAASPSCVSFTWSSSYKQL